ncbi:MAG TPA: FecR domain-containing protein [Bacteroidales bacterium]|nr:FecR domain-containing protein [Bacteroidales bacterium]
MNREPDNHNPAGDGMDTREKILSRMSVMDVAGGKSREEALAELKRRISKQNETKTTSEKNSYRIYAWAASVAATLLILFVLSRFIPGIQSEKIITEKGVHSEYILPDGSDINLNAGSRISFRKKGFNEKRDVILTGEAFFSVNRPGQFKVITKNGTISVLGTTFNVYSRDNSLKVTCYTGKVMISAGKQNVTLFPGEDAELANGALKVLKESRKGSVSGWINGDFYFENSPLNDVFAEVERQFDVKFVTNIREDKLFYTGGFTNNNLNEALESICIPMKLNYKIDTNKEISVSYKE